MGLMPGNIVKGRILKKFDEFINTPKPKDEAESNLEKALKEYENQGITLKGILQFGVQKSIVPPEKPLGGSYKHIVNDWLPEIDVPALDPTPEKLRSWWPKHYPMGEVLRQGLINALRLCLYEDPDVEQPATRVKPLLIDTYWVCAGSHYEVAALLGTTSSGEPHHVTMLIMTPSVPLSDRAGPYSDDIDNIWVTRHDDVEPGMKGVTTTNKGIETVRPRKEIAENG